MTVKNLSETHKCMLPKTVPQIFLTDEVVFNPYPANAENMVSSI